MESVINQRVAPLVKCMVLFLLIFTAKVLTSRPQENHDSKNSIQHTKANHYVRTFTKYHHRRTIQWNSLPDNGYWPHHNEQTKHIGKRSVEFENSNELVHKEVDMGNLEQFAANSGADNIIGSQSKSASKSDIGKNEIVKVKSKPVVSKGDTISCMYKINSVAMSVTPSYEYGKENEDAVENDNFDTPGRITDMVLYTGERVQIEECTEPRATCYTLWQRGKNGNNTVLGQGCWRDSPKRSSSNCDKCSVVTSLLPETVFCCCTKSYCNGNFLSIKEEVVTPKAESTTDKSAITTNYSNIAAAAILTLVAILVIGVAFRRMYCNRHTIDKDDLSDGIDAEKGDIMGSGPDALATGLLCVDNLTLIEHIGQGRFGSVWRGSLGSSPVAVKLYSNQSAWQKEAAIYSMPQLAHPNLLKYYGSDSRRTLSGRPEHLLVLELCACSLRSVLIARALSWQEFAHLAHGIASALAHLHSSTATKPCIVHRDVNSNNVLISMDGQARLADLGLAQAVCRSQPTSIMEAGTVRYLSPEALEGALDLSGARAALCAVDVFALGLVLWELLWRTAGAHRQQRAPPYAPPHHQLPDNPTLQQVQNLVSRKKARPPLPPGPAAEPRALRLAADTCEECWDHDAEARLTAVCVEERMSELKQMLSAPQPLIHDNNLHPDQTDTQTTPDTDKNSNCVSSQTCDVTTPLLYPPHVGRNPCLERNTHTHTHTHTAPLIHKSLKDITVPQVDGPRVQNVDENCLSVARVNPNRVIVNENSDRFNEIRTYQRPLDYIPNDVSSSDDRGPKQTNLLHDVKIEKPRWGLKKYLQKKLQKNPKDTEVKLVQENSSNSSNEGRIRTSIIDKQTNFNRPANIVISHDRNYYNYETPCLSPPNRTLSPTMFSENELQQNRALKYKEIPTANDETVTPNQIFAVIVPKGTTNLIEMRNKNAQGSTDSLRKSVKTSMSSQSIFKSSGNSESEDSTLKKRLSADNKIITNSNSGRSSRASLNYEMHYLDNQVENFPDSPFELNSDCSSSEDEHLMLLSENGGSKITMQTVAKNQDIRKTEPLKEATQTKSDFSFNKYQNKYSNFDNEFSDQNEKENLKYSVENPVYTATLNGEMDANDLKYLNMTKPELGDSGQPKSPKPSLKSLTIKRQHSLEQVSELFSSSSDVQLQNPAGRVKTPGAPPPALRRARRHRALQAGKGEGNRLSLYDDRMMFGNSL